MSTKRKSSHIRLSSDNYEKVRTIAYLRNATISATIDNIVTEYVATNMDITEQETLWAILNKKAKAIREDK